MSCLNDFRRKEFQQRAEMPPAVEPWRLCIPQYTVSLLNLLLRNSSVHVVVEVGVIIAQFGAAFLSILLIGQPVA